MSTPASVADVLALAALVVDDLVVATTRDTHAAVSRRVERTLGVGPVTTPAQAAHRVVAATVYGAVGMSLRGSSRALAAAGATGLGVLGGPLEAGARGRFVIAAANGLIGDELHRERPRLAIEMGVRVGGRDVDLTPPGLADAFPSPTGRIVVLVHGLCENETYWQRHRDRVGTTYAESVTDEGWTPVFIRANTGLAVRENGVALSALLQRLVEAWPVPVAQVALVGHSMGGLIARAALSVQTETTGSWAARTSDLVTLGSPHLGAPLARTAERGSGLLGRLPESRAFQTILERRSVGIRDLQAGDAEPPCHGLRVRHRLVAATLSGSARHPVAHTVGDLLVTPPSAYGRAGATNLFPGATTLHVGRTGHFGLLNHREVDAALRRWLAEPWSATG